MLRTEMPCDKWQRNDRCKTVKDLFHPIWLAVELTQSVQLHKFVRLNVYRAMKITVMKRLDGCDFNISKRIPYTECIAFHFAVINRTKQ